MHGAACGALGALTGVDDDVFGEVTHIDKGFIADSALVRSDVVVVPDVVGQLARLHEPGGDRDEDAVVALPQHCCVQGGHHGGRSPLAAALTDVGLLPCVLAHVGDEGAGLGERLPADQALARLLSWGGSRRVQPQGEPTWNPSALQGKAARNLSCIPTCVDADMPLQRPGVGKLSLAVHTDIGLLPAVDPEVPLQVACVQLHLRQQHGDSGASPHPSLCRMQQGLHNGLGRWEGHLCPTDQLLSGAAPGCEV